VIIHGVFLNGFSQLCHCLGLVTFRSLFATGCRVVALLFSLSLYQCCVYEFVADISFRLRFNWLMWNVVLFSIEVLDNLFLVICSECV